MQDSDSPSETDDQQNDEAIAVALKRSLLAFSCIGLVVGLFFAFQWFFPPAEQEEVQTEIELPQQRAEVAQELPSIPLTDITSQCGVSWIHESGMEGEKLLPETMGGGVAIFDFDRDGDQDILFVGGKSWDWSKNPNPNPRSLCLYANDGNANFTDVTVPAGLDVSLYGMGPSVGDFDNDGWPDLYITTVGRDVLLHNQQGVFHDVTDAAKLASPESWSTGATWLDFNRDGWLDLFVCDYVVWDRKLDLSLGFKLTGVGRAYGQPTAFTGTHGRLYQNDGKGSFTNVTQTMGIEVTNANTGVPVGKGLGVAAIDIDQDGWQDIFVANDTVQNFLFLNNAGEGFYEAGIPMGVAFDRSGNATGAMGVDCCFLRNNSALAIAVGNFANEQSSLFMSRHAGDEFTDQALVTGLGPVSRLNLTFGMCFADLDLDGRQDLFCSNGHLEEEISKVQSTQRYEQPPQFFWNAGQGGSSELVALTADQVGSIAEAALVGRGAACGDLDNDGDLDIVLVANSGSPLVLRNDLANDHHWVRLRLQGAEGSNLDALGAIVELSSDGQTQRRIVTSTRSYLSQCEHPLTFGLGPTDEIDDIVVTWPSGREEHFQVSVDQAHNIVEGTGQAKQQ